MGWRPQTSPLRRQKAAFPLASEASRRLGDQWLREKSAAVLSVPSVLATAERNYLLNPKHPDFRRLRLGKPERFTFDARLIGQTK